MLVPRDMNILSVPVVLSKALVDVALGTAAAFSLSTRR
jgi:hypothetical protein